MGSKALAASPTTGAFGNVNNLELERSTGFEARQLGLHLGFTLYDFVKSRPQRLLHTAIPGLAAGISHP